jgi:ribosome-associated protein
MHETDDSDERPSKSQRKREMNDLRDLAVRLTELTSDQLSRINYPQIRDAIEAAKKITKGNARKRQIQYTAKLLSKIDVDDIRLIINEMDASSAAYVQKFHQLETWREQLINQEPEVMDQIFSQHPQADRPHLRQLVRHAVQEREKGEQQVHFRKLFQYLRQLSEEEY